MKQNWKFFLKILVAIFVFIIIVAILIYNGIVWHIKPSLMGYDVRGIDVSRYQGDIDWKVISEQNISFAFIKATEGSSYKDPLFDKNIIGSSENFIASGAYHFFSIETSGKTQAENFIAVTSPYEMNLPPVLDFEVGEWQENKTEIINEAKTFLVELEKFYGVKPIIYTTYESYDAFLSEGFSDYPLWFRDLLHKPNIKTGKDFLFWQYSNRGRLRGIDKTQKYTDLNVFNGSFEEFEWFIKKDFK